MQLRNILGGVLNGTSQALDVAARAGYNYENMKQAVIAANMKDQRDREITAASFAHDKTMADLHAEYNAKAAQQQHEWAGQADDKNYAQQITLHGLGVNDQDKAALRSHQWDMEKDATNFAQAKELKGMDRVEGDGGKLKVDILQKQIEDARKSLADERPGTNAYMQAQRTIDRNNAVLNSYVGVAADDAPKPSGDVKGFVAAYMPAAQKAALSLGVQPEMLLGQWGLETGWGKSIVPGTNNLGNIKDFRGGGVTAKDNQNGSVDKYRAFDSTDSFADHHASLLSRKYPNTVGAKTPEEFAKGLDGYAEDPKYRTKLASAIGMVSKVKQGGSDTKPFAQAGDGKATDISKNDRIALSKELKDSPAQIPLAKNLILDKGLPLEDAVALATGASNLVDEDGNKIAGRFKLSDGSIYVHPLARMMEANDAAEAKAKATQAAKAEQSIQAQMEAENTRRKAALITPTYGRGHAYTPKTEPRGYGRGFGSG